MLVYENHSMKKHSSMKIGGVAKKFIEVETREEIISLLKNLTNYFIIGNGTNTLINDGVLDKTFISLKQLKKIEVISEEEIRVEAGLGFGHLIKYMEENDLSGIEELGGIPGTVGGLVYMNGGAYKREIFDCIERVEVIDENFVLRSLDKKDLKIGYRYTEMKEKSWIIVSVDFKFKKGFKKEIIEDIRIKRREKQPLEYPNLGSIFKNPEGDFAAKLISEAGLQGLKIGGAQVSTKHSNFIVNIKDASFNDVIKLVEKIEEEINKKFSINLEREIIILK